HDGGRAGNELAEMAPEGAGIEVVAAARAEADQDAHRLAGIEIGDRVGVRRQAGHGQECRAGECPDRKPPTPGRAHARYSAAMCASRCTSVLMSCSGEAVSSSMPQPRTQS